MSRPTTSAGFALLRANLRYWTTVAPLVRTLVSRWDLRARAIPAPALRRSALEKLRAERFNVQGAATLATLAPSAHREHAAEAIVALQVMYDYLDLLTEQPLPDPPADGRRLYGALVDALTLDRQPAEDHYRHDPSADDGGYLRELASTVRDAFARLPAAAAVGEVALHSARRCAEAQVRSHAAMRSDGVELECWARREAAGTGLQWPEFLAGAMASVLAVHALIAAAADRGTTRRDAERIDAAYLSIGALTMLDSVVDRRRDSEAGESGFLACYQSPEAMGARIESIAKDAVARAQTLPNGAHHVITIVGIVAFYSSAPAARGGFARPITAPVRAELEPLITPTLALMRAWRLAKRWRSAGAAGVSSLRTRRSLRRA